MKCLQVVSVNGLLDNLQLITPYQEVIEAIDRLEMTGTLLGEEDFVNEVKVGLFLWLFIPMKIYCSQRLFII